MQDTSIISLIEKEISRLQAALSVLKGEAPHTPITINSASPIIPQIVTNQSQYSSAMELRDKFLFFLREKKRFVHLREVADWIAETEGLNEKSTIEISSKIGASIHILKKSGDIVKIQPQANNLFTYWGLKKWLNENGEIKQGHEYNKEYPKSKNVKAAKSYSLDF